MKRNNNSLTTLICLAAACIAWGAAFPLVAAGQSDAAQVLDDWTEALGGRDRLAAVNSVRSTWTVKALGLEGTIEEWLTAEGNHRIDLDLAGIFKISTVRTPAQCWYLDQNGKVSEQSGKNLEDEIQNVFLGTWSHLLPGRMKGKGELLAPDPETLDVRVKIVPENGTEITFWIDKETHLPLRSESPAESREIMTTTYSDWRSVEGVLFPAKIEQTTGTPENDFVIELAQVQLNESFSANTFGRPGEQADDVHFSSGGEARNIPLEIDGVHLLVQVQLNDSRPLWFLIDTGAEVTVVDETLAGELGFELTGTMMGSGNGPDAVEVHIIQNASFRVPGVELTDQTVFTVALRDILEGRIGREIDGILGYDFISRFVMEIDYANAQLHLYDRHTWEYEGEGTDVAIWFVDMVPNCAVTVTLPDGTALDCNVYVDTGSGNTLKFNKPFTEQHDLLSAVSATVKASGGYGVGGATHSYLGRIVALQLGDLEFREPNCSFSLDETGGRANASLAAQLGGGILEHCTVIFDYERERMYLEPNENFGTPFPGEMCGLSLQTGGRGDWHTFTVVSVIEESPADKAGVNSGDVIVAVDGKPAAQFRLQDLRAIFGEEGRKVTLELRRDGETFSTGVIMKRMM